MTKIRGLLCDGDGVIWINGVPLPGAVDALRKVRSLGVRPVLVTNNSSKTRGQYLSFLSSIGLSDFTLDDVFSSGYAAALYLQSQSLRSAFVMGSAALCAELALVGIDVHTIATDPEPKQVEAVVCAIGDLFRYGEIARCIYLVKKFGARLIGTNPDPNFPFTHDIFVLGSGAIAGAVEAGTGETATMVGKPEDFMFFTILEALGMSEDEVMMVGDRWITDIAFAARHGARSVLVLSGVDTEEDLKAVPPELRPTYILPSLVEVASLVEELNRSV